MNDLRSIVVLNDFHPAEYPGAASEALNSAIDLAKYYQVKFITSGPTHGTTFNQDVFTYQIRRLSMHNQILDRRRSHMIIRISGLIMRHLALCKIAPILFENRKSTFIVHKVGSIYPLTIILLLNLIKSRVIFVHHDYTVITNGKLYPYHFASRDIIEKTSNLLQDNIGLKVARFSIRRSIIRALLNTCTVQATLSKIQHQVLNANGFRCTLELTQTVQECRCSNIDQFPARSRSDKIRILFLGRAIGKGFYELIELVKNSPSLYLVAAGPTYLMEILGKFLPSSKYEFLGTLEPNQVSMAIHECDLIWARSMYFDVGPLTILEGLAHGRPVVCTPTTGNSTHARNVMNSLVKPLIFSLEETLVHGIIHEWVYFDNHNKAINYVKQLRSGKSYFDVISELPSP